MNILILCAGYGSRLAPLTDRIPKPLIPVGDTPHLKLQIQKCSILNYKHLFINSHHLHDKMQEFAACTDEISQVFYEEEILGTGTPLKRVFQSGYDDDLLVINGDIYHNFDLMDFVEQSQTSPLSFLCFDHPSVNTLVLDSESHVVGVKNSYGQQEGNKDLTFAGISWYSRECLKKMRDDYFDVKAFWKVLSESSIYPRAIMQNNKTWIDIGTPKGLYKSSFEAINSRTSTVQSEFHDITDCIIHARIDQKTHLSLHKSIVLEAPTRNISSQEPVIIGKDFLWKI